MFENPRQTNEAIFYDRQADQTRIRMAEQEPEARWAILGMDPKGHRLFMSRSVRHARLTGFLRDAGRFPWSCRIVSYTGDELTMDLRCREPGYLSFIDNWDPKWEAFIDGHETRMELLFGTFKSVPVRPGFHTVVFRYVAGL
jgi:hypothetical protein